MDLLLVVCSSQAFLDSNLMPVLSACIQLQAIMGIVPYRNEVHVQAFSTCDGTCDSLSTTLYRYTLLAHRRAFDHWFDGGSKNAHQGKLVQGFWDDLVILLEHLA